MEEGFVRRERLRHHTINLPKRENVLYSRNNSIFVSFVTPGRQRAQVLATQCRRTRKFTDIGLCGPWTVGAHPLQIEWRLPSVPHTPVFVITGHRRRLLRPLRPSRPSAHIRHR